MLDYDLTNKKLLNEEFVTLLKKYAVILAVMLLFRTGAYMLLPYMSSLFSAMEVAYYNIGISGTMYLLNLITAIFIYSDMNKSNTISWSIIALTLLANEAGVVFFLLYILHQSIQRNNDSQPDAA